MTKANHKWYVLALLFVTYIFNIVDRHIINILLEPIKIDLALSDAQAGFLAGFAFAIFYTVMGVPIAVLADRFNRAKLIALCVALWTVMTAMTGAASNFVSMAVARMGVGVGEAGLTPSANSLIGDVFKPNERGRAIGIYHSAVPIGSMIAAFLGGTLGSYVGWRMTFIILGVAGLLVAALVRITLIEPPRGYLDDVSSTPEKEQYSVIETATYLFRLKSCRYFMAAVALVGFVGNAINTWTPAFFMRTHEMNLMDMAIVVGTIGGIGGAIGMVAGGLVADYYGSRDARSYMRIPAIALLTTLPLYSGVYLASEPWMASGMLIAPVITGAIIFPPIITLLQKLVKNNMRAVAVAILLLVLHLVGMGLGPLVVGLISDLLQPIYGTNSLRFALLSVMPINLLAVWLFWRASNVILPDITHCVSDASTSSTI